MARVVDDRGGDESGSVVKAQVEMVDVVDGQDRVVSQASRAEVRDRHLRHRAVYVLVFNGRGQLFVHRRTASKDVFPSHYDVAAGGVVVAGESYDEAARRELAEELGIADIVLRRVVSLRFDDQDNHINGMVYSCTWDGPVQLQVEEIESGEWLDLDVVAERTQSVPFCPDGLEALCRYLDRLQQVREG
jgi:isopentenyldiphosphate isomerase